MANTPLEYIHKKQGQKDAQAIVVWLHGLGASGHDFANCLSYLGLPASVSLDFYFPHAPRLAVTINGGLQMPAWYDIISMDFERQVDVQQIHASAQAIAELCQRVNPDNKPLILAGFSQGAAMVLHLALSKTVKPKAVLALSGYVADPSVLQTSDASFSLHHGDQDPVVPFALGQRAVQALTQHANQVEFHPWPMGHEVQLPQLQEIGQWFVKQLNDC